MSRNFNGPSYGDLPMEIILHIMSYLNPSDILEAGLTCRRWFEAALHPVFIDKFQLNFYKVQLNDANEPTSPLNAFINSFRFYTKIILNQVDFGQTEEFWQRFGNQFTEITFDTCDLREKTFNNILKMLTNLQTLEINNCRELFMSGRLFKNLYEKDAICSACSNVRHIRLCNNRYLSDALFNRIVATMRNIQSIDLSGCHISFHNGLYRKFYPDSQRDASESVLTFYYILQFIEFQAEHLKSLNFSGTLIDGSALTRLAEVQNLKLDKLILRSCDQLTNTGISTFVRHQCQLTELDLSMSVRLTDLSLIEICKSLTQLKVLKLRRCRALTDIGVCEIYLLKNLSVLDISECDAITSDGLLNGILKESRNNELIELHVSALNICELAVVRIAEYLPNLTLLDLSFCKNAVTDLAVQLIFKNLVKLRTLNLEFCDKITDGGVTGMEMSTKLDSYEKFKVTTVPNRDCLDGAGSSRVSAPIAGPYGVSAELMPNIKHDKDLQQLRQSIEESEVLIRHQDRQPYRISLRSKAEEDIVNDAKRKKVMLEMCDLSTNSRDINCTHYTISRLKGLRNLNLTACNHITDVSLKYCFNFLELKALSLAKCQQISSVGIASFIQKCPSLEVVNISECHNINDKAIESIAIHLPRLTHLHIERCSQLTDHSLDYISVNCKCLKFLDVRGCRSMCTEPNLRVEHVRSLKQVVMSKPGPYLASIYDTHVKPPKAPPLPSSF